MGDGYSKAVVFDKALEYVQKALLFQKSPEQLQQHKFIIEELDSAGWVHPKKLQKEVCG